MKADPRTTEDVIDLHERFCRGFETRDAAGVMEIITPDADVTIVTSEDALLRGVEELRAFLDNYVQGRRRIHGCGRGATCRWRARLRGSLPKDRKPLLHET